MRDPARIGKILGELRVLWELYPDQRLGQLLSNYVLANEGFGRVPYFYQEDDVTLDNIDKALREFES